MMFLNLDALVTMPRLKKYKERGGEAL